MRARIKALLQTVTGLGLRHYPVESWPAWAGDLMLMKVPANVSENPDPSPAGGADIDIILELVGRIRHVAGDFVECGVYRGQTLLTMALHLKQAGEVRLVHGFDSFEGFDDSVDYDLALAGQTDSELRRGGFGDTSIEIVKRRLHALTLENSVRLHQGFFQQTLNRLSGTQIAFAHIDCDIYASYKVCLEQIYPIMSSGGIILLDEYNDDHWPGCNKAVDEFLFDKPENLQAIEKNNNRKYFIVKVESAGSHCVRI